MITINSLDIGGIIFTGIHLELPQANIFIIMNETGYIISATFAIEFFNEYGFERKAIAAVMPQVKKIDDLLHAPIEKVTEEAKRVGWFIGMKGKDALLKIA